MIKRYYHNGLMATEADNGMWCKYSDVERLEQERDQLAARVEQYLEWLEEWLPNEAFDSLIGSTKNELAEHDRELLLRLADDLKEKVIDCKYNGPLVRLQGYISAEKWLRAKAEDYDN